MSEIIKTCKYHGDLTSDAILFSKKTNEKRCRHCQVESNRKWRAKNPLKITEYNRNDYVKHQKERDKATAAWKKKTGYKKKLIKDEVRLLKTSYIKNLIINKNKNIKAEDISNDLVKAKRQNVKLKRLIREKESSLGRISRILHKS